MRKIVLLIVISIHLMSGVVFGADIWAKIEPAGSRYASDIDTYVTTNNESLDRIMTNFRDNCVIYYVSDASIGVKSGSVVCSNTAGSLRRFRTNTSATSNSPALSASTKYYVYAIADADATTFTLEVVTNASIPTAGTYYKRLGSFYTDSDSDILNDNTLVNDNNYYALRFGDWTNKSNNTVYQASTDGYVLAIGGSSTINGYTDSNADPTGTLIATNSGGTGFMFPVKKLDYWKVVNADTSVSWLPLEREV